ncbi:MAG: iron ABC transporter permease [Atribacterota bacterium]|nr:iron ABC transporter permease [Atribacterota bacterium]
MSVGATLVVILIALFFFSFLLGRYPISPLIVGKVFISRILPISHTWPPTVETVVFFVRLPRIVAAMLAGAGLSVSGASFQGIFNNPLVSPYILGVSAGAGFGAALAILLSESLLTIQVSAFVFGILAALLSLIIGRAHKSTSTLTLVLGGIIVGALFSALLSLIKYIADPYDKLPAIVFWLMGSLSSVSNKDLLMLAPPILSGTFVLLLIRWKINILSMGDEEAQTLGVNPKKLRIVIIVCGVLITAASVSMSGIIGWVGLVIPHIGRMLVGPDYKKLLPVSILIGAAYLLLIDDLARTLTVAEIPLGIITAIVGAPIFAYLLQKRKTGWHD